MAFTVKTVYTAVILNSIMHNLVTNRAIFSVFLMGRFTDM